MKKAAAQATLNEIQNIFEQKILESTEKRPFVFGLGTGSTIAEFWPIFSNYLETLKSKHLVIVPTSYQSKQLVVACRYPLVDLCQYQKVDCLVDGFDELQVSTGSMIKGGGGAQTLEKLVACSSSYSIYIGTGDKISSSLGKRNVPIPIEVIPPAAYYVSHLLAKHGGTCNIRESKSGKMGPVVTDLGNFILDWLIPADHELWKDLQSLERLIQNTVGVVACGVFVNQVDLAIVAHEDGRIERNAYNRT